MGRPYPLVLLAVVLLFYAGAAAAQAANVEIPPAVGGGGAFIPPPRILEGGVYVLTLTLMKSIIEGLGLRDRPYFTGPKTLAATLSSAGEYHAPTYPSLTALLTTPVRDIPSPERLVKDITVISPSSADEFYTLSAKKVTEKYYSASTVVLARRDPPVDGMASLGWSRELGTPILPVEEGSIPNATLLALKKLDPLKIIIVGGPVAVSGSVETELRKIARVERVWGENRFETAVKVASKIENPRVVVVADGYNPGVDALIVSGEYKAPIVYTRGAEIPRVTGEYLLKHKPSSRREDVTWILVGLDRGTVSEIKAMYDLPDPLLKARWIVNLYKVGSRILSLAGG